MFSMGWAKLMTHQGRLSQLGAIQLINTTAYLDSSHYVMVEYGEYTESEVDVLCE